ncbi:MAG TPA: D-alanyl-D-alanine carboxypeptidase [Patescibacteria group bacterium]
MVFPRLRKDQYVSLVLLNLMLVLGGIRSQVSLAQIVTQEAAVELVETAPIPIRQTKAEEPLISAPAAIVIDLPSASILYDKHAHDYRHPASTAKLMTALVARRSFSGDHTFTVKSEAYTNGTTVGFTPGMVISLEDTLKGLLIQSGNDAAFLLANNFSGGYSAFVQEMNQTAQALHLGQTSYTNPSGLDEPNQVTTPFDLSVLTREVLKDEFLAATVATPSATIRDLSSGQRFQVYTTNRLLTPTSPYRGVKTGTTELAGEVLVSRYQAEERDLLLIVMGSQDRYQDTQALTEWVLSQYRWQSVD